MRKEGDDFEQGRDPGGGRSEPLEPARSGITPRQIVIGIVAIILIAFAVVNFESVPVDFLLFDTDARLVTVILVSAGLGFVIGYFVGRPSREERRVLRRHERRTDDD
jgi:uncharacterized integral membrane protein